jgi:hypothetical protein
VRCPRCGNENPGENRFCGMCGATLLVPAPIPPKPQPVSAPPPGPTPIRGEAAPLASPEPPRAPAATEDSPSISGPSFLGLGNPSPRSPVSRSRASLSTDPSHAPSSRSLDYLLEDDDEPRSSGAGKYLLILIALGLAVGFGYLRWKNQGLPWLNVLVKKPVAATTSAPDTTSSNSAPAASPASPTPSITPEPQAVVPVQQQPAAGTVQPPANSSATPSNPPSTPASTTPATTPATGNTPPATQPAGDNSKANDSDSSAANPEKGAVAATKDSAAAKAPPSDSGDNADEDTSPAPAKPAPKPKPTVPAVDPVSEAQKYLYGRGGVSQDCDRGMRLLKPAANQGNPKAMVEMGALYSAGLCTPHDLPTAYRWFALALRKQPDNASIQADLQKLWSEMTQPERQLAIKLSQ